MNDVRQQEDKYHAGIARIPAEDVYQGALVPGWLAVQFDLKEFP